MKLKDKDWNLALDAIVGRFLTSFIVNYYEDRELLKTILKKFSCDNQIILIREINREWREPPGQFLTAFRVLEFDKSIVGDMLRVMTGLERILLCRSRSEAMSILNQSPSNIDAAFTLDAAKITTGRQTQSFFSFRSKDGKSRFFDDPETQIR